jgi:putative hydrolase
MSRRPPPPDPNTTLASLFLDLAAVHETTARRWGYQRAAGTMLNLPVPISELVEGGRLRKVPTIGPATTRIILEFLESGTSQTADQLIARSNRAAEIERLRDLRGRFLSHAAVRHVLREKRPGTITRAHYRGDFQMHSEWSDGAESIEAMVQSCIGLGYTCACLTDHSPGQKVPRGMSLDQMRRQQVEIRRINRTYRGRFRVFTGVEANIRADGTIDVPPDRFNGLEIIVASPHSLLRSAADQTARMVAAVEQPGVNILGHPRGRRFNVRQGVAADWHQVFAAAARRGVAIEIDGYPDRQDIDFDLAREALQAGCLFALDSDAHAPDELPYAAYALAHARLAGIPRERIVNSWSDEEILEWAARARRA